MSAGKFVEEKVETDSWLVVEPTHLETYAPQNGFIFPKFRGGNFELPPPRKIAMLWASKLCRISWAANKINGWVDPNKLLRDDDLSGMIHPPSYVTRWTPRTQF